MKDLNHNDKEKDFFQQSRIVITNFNRIFNTILVLLSLVIYFSLRIMDAYNTEDVNNNKYRFLVKAMMLSKVFILMNIANFILIQKQNKILSETIAIANNIFFSIFFQMVSGILRSYLFNSSDPLIFVTSVEIICRYLILTYYYTSFRIMAYSSFIILFYSWISMVLYHTTVPLPIIFYNTIITLVFGMLTIYSKTFENSKIIESELKKTRENERNYYINILDNLNVGFFISEGSKVNLFNKYISNIMDTYNKKKLIPYEDDNSINNVKLSDNNISKPQEGTKDTTKNSNAMRQEAFGFLRFLYEENVVSEDDADYIEDSSNNDRVSSIIYNLLTYY